MNQRTIPGNVYCYVLITQKTGYKLAEWNKTQISLKKLKLISERIVQECFRPLICLYDTLHGRLERMCFVQQKLMTNPVKTDTYRGHMSGYLYCLVGSRYQKCLYYYCN